MRNSRLKGKSALRTIRRAYDSWYDTIAIFLLAWAFACYLGWSAFMQPGWMRQTLAVAGGLMTLYGTIFVVLERNYCQIDVQKRLIASSTTTWYLKNIVHHYSWDDFCTVRTVLAYLGEDKVNRVELVSKNKFSVLTIAYFPPITPPSGGKLLSPYDCENPLALLLRTELSLLMSLSNQGYIKEQDLKLLP